MCRSPAPSWSATASGTCWLPGAARRSVLGCYPAATVSMSWSARGLTGCMKIPPTCWITSMRWVAAADGHPGSLPRSLRQRWQLRGIYDSPIGRLGLQPRVERQWQVEPVDGEAVQPGIVVAHAPEGHSIELALQCPEGGEVPGIEVSLLRDQRCGNRAAVGAVVGRVVCPFVHAQIQLGDLLMKVREDCGERIDCDKHRQR